MSGTSRNISDGRYGRVRYSRLDGHPEGSAHYIVSLEARVTAVSELVVILLLSIRYSKHSTVIIVIYHSLIILHVWDGVYFYAQYEYCTVLGCVCGRACTSH